jgi:hypothetical protein
MPWRTSTIAAVIAALAVPAHADERPSGLYFAQSLGVGQAKGDLKETVGNSIESRLTLGARLRWLAIEGFAESNVQTDREGAFKGFLGGDPAEGRADLEMYGFAVRLIAPLYKSPTGEKLEGYVRFSPSVVGGTGALTDYRGYGLGGSAGIALTGKVRALGFLWAPLFFVKKGPKVTGSLFIDTGWDFVRLESKDEMQTLHARVGHVSVGFAVGQTF